MNTLFKRKQKKSSDKGRTNKKPNIGIALKDEKKESEANETAINHKNDNKIKKKRKEIVRKCNKCNSLFKATRSDAKYCSDSCRQIANRKGYNFAYYENPAEHFLVYSMRNILTIFLENENTVITNDRFLGWFEICMILRSQFFPFLEEGNYYREYFNNNIEQTLGDLQKQINRSSNNTAIMNIHPTIKQQWVEFIEYFD